MELSPKCVTFAIGNRKQITGRQNTFCRLFKYTKQMLQKYEKHELKILKSLKVLIQQVEKQRLEKKMTYKTTIVWKNTVALQFG